MLLPWAGLGWIVGLTVLAATRIDAGATPPSPRSSWRTVGAVNATALLMIAPAPVLWLLAAGVRRHDHVAPGGRRRRCASAGCRSACRCGGSRASSIQGRHGADVLAYSESLESVSYTSTSPEVWRNLGYWLTYVRDAYAADDRRPARDYMVSGRLIATGFVLLLIGLAGLVATRWTHRRFAVALVVVGVVLGVGVHPIDDPSPLMDLAARRRHVRRRAGPALAHPRRADARARARPRRRRARRRAAARCASPAALPWRPVARRRSSACSPSPTCRCSPDTAWSTRRSTATRTRPRRGPTPPPRSTPATPAHACCSCRARSSAPSAGATPSTRRCPGMTDKPLVTRDLLPLGSARGDGPAVRPRRPLPVAAPSSPAAIAPSPACSAPTRSG